MELPPEALEGLLVADGEEEAEAKAEELPPAVVEAAVLVAAPFPELVVVLAPEAVVVMPPLTSVSVDAVLLIDPEMKLPMQVASMASGSILALWRAGPIQP
jgi:hypothetical protein